MLSLNRVVVKCQIIQRIKYHEASTINQIPNTYYRIVHRKSTFSTTTKMGKYTYTYTNILCIAQFILRPALSLPLILSNDLSVHTFLEYVRKFVLPLAIHIEFFLSLSPSPSLLLPLFVASIAHFIMWMEFM